MNLIEIIRKIVAEKGVSQKSLATMLGYRSQGSIGSLLTKKDITSNNAAKFLDVLGYEIVVRPKTVGRKRDGEIVVAPDYELKSGCENNGRRAAEDTAE